MFLESVVHLEVLRVLRRCFKDFFGYFKGVSEVFQECFKGASRMFHGCSKCVSKVLQGCFKAA